MIHFVSLVSLEYDADLFDFFIGFYRRFGFDTYNVYLHADAPLNKDFIDSSIKNFNDAGYKTTLIGGKYNERSLEKKVFDSFVSTVKPHDYIFRADVDEYGELPEYISDVIKKHDIITGLLIDRWSGKLKAADGKTPLSDQYPYCGDFEKTNNIAHSFPMKRSKIIAARADIPVLFNGSHGIDGNIDNFKTVGPFKIMHYKYRACLIDKMCARPYFTSPYISEVMRFFNIGYNGSYQKRLQGSFPPGVGHE